MLAEHGDLRSRKKTYWLMGWMTKGALEEFLTSDELDGGSWCAVKETGDVRAWSEVARLTWLGTTDFAELNTQVPSTTMSAEYLRTTPG